MIDFTKPNDLISPNFKVHEALLLPSWGVMHVPTDFEIKNIVKTALVMEQIRTLFGTGINVHCWIRPKKANISGFDANKFATTLTDHNKIAYVKQGNYNGYVGGAQFSAHILGLAVDFDVTGLDCDTVRATLEPKLASLNICMEKTPGSNWVHIDLMLPRGGTTRYFIP